jgi:hypothetical protein
MDYDARNNARIRPEGGPHRWSTLARFAPTFDVRSDSEWGTLRGFAEVEFDWVSGTWASTGAFTGTQQSVNLNHAYIELQQAMGTLRLGKGDSPYARFLGYGVGGRFGGTYGFRNGAELSYTFNAGGGLSAIVAVTEGQTGAFEPGFEGGVNFAQAWGSVGVIAGYDNRQILSDSWGVKAVARVNFAPASFNMHVFYSNGAGRYAIVNPAGGVSTWSVLAGARASFTPTVAAKAQAQWFQSTAVSNGSSWQVGGGLVLTPIRGLEILPEVLYTTRANAFGDSNWQAALRFNRTF